VDGASGFSLFRWITFPLLSPVTFFLFIMNMVFSFFEPSASFIAVTQGGPGDATTIMVYKVYLDGFVNMRIGVSAAQSVILMALVIFLTVLSSVIQRGRSSTNGSYCFQPGNRRRRDWTKVIVHILLISRFHDWFSTLLLACHQHPEHRGGDSKPQSLLPSTHLVENYAKVWNRTHMGRLLINSAIVAVTVSLGKILISIISAFAIVYFNFRGKQIAFWLIFVTLMLLFRFVSSQPSGRSNPGVGRYLCGTDYSIDRFGDSPFLFRQFYLTSRMNWWTPPRSMGPDPFAFSGLFCCQLRSQHRSAFVVMFIFGWNQYLWPLMVTTQKR